MILQTILCSLFGQNCPSDLYEDGHIDVIDSFVILQSGDLVPIHAVKISMVISPSACQIC